MQIPACSQPVMGFQGIEENQPSVIQIVFESECLINVNYLWVPKTTQYFYAGRLHFPRFAVHHLVCHNFTETKIV